jgi:drug/metabolite transporter (DMT)-like permease
LLLNLEAVLTAVIAWVVFRENTDRHVVLGMLAIIAGAVLLAWPRPHENAGLGWSALLIAAACLCWALDNNFTRKVSATGEAMLVGLLGYGVSLVLFVLALRGLGTARTGAYFSTAPFLGAAIAILVFGEHASTLFWVAAVLMGIGVWLHLTERHEHMHTHEAITHTHRHVHDIHHQHTHDFPWDGTEPHTHPHTHDPITHSHPHYPDIHHQHRHD